VCDRDVPDAGVCAVVDRGACLTQPDDELLLHGRRRVTDDELDRELDRRRDMLRGRITFLIDVFEQIQRELAAIDDAKGRAEAAWQVDTAPRPAGDPTAGRETLATVGFICMSDPTTFMQSPPTERGNRRWLLPTAVGGVGFLFGLIVGFAGGFAGGRAMPRRPAPRPRPRAPRRRPRRTRTVAAPAPSTPR
jgi:hypothetical protein